MASFRGKLNVGASATDSRLSGMSLPASYSPAGTGPAGPWPAKGNTAAYTPEVSTLIVLTVAEIGLLAWLRHSFRRYHGG